jgi:ParB/RepB/Spo0J family partition protein
MVMHASKKMAKWALDRLQAHPKQALLFSPPPLDEVKELADDIKLNGLLQPVEILPDGTVVCGHKRLAAVRLLGWTHIDVWIRDDLAHDSVAAETRLITDNLHRRQLGPLELAKCYLALKVLARANGATYSPDQERRDLRDELGKRLGVSGRNLDRYLRVATQTPTEVQDAVAVGKLAVTLAEKVAGLTTEERDQIAKMIRSGGHARDVVRQFLAAAAPRAKHGPDNAKAAFVSSVASTVRDLNGRVGEITWISPTDAKVLAAGAQLIQQMRKRFREHGAPVASTDERSAEAVGEDDDAAGVAVGRR